MNIKNLQRAAEISNVLPGLEEARRKLSDGERASVGGVTLPKSLTLNILNAVNVEINALKKEIEDL